MRKVYLSLVLCALFPFPFLFSLVVPVLESVFATLPLVKREMKIVLGLGAILTITFINTQLLHVSDVYVNLQWIEEIGNGEFNTDYIKGEYLYLYLIQCITVFFNDPELVRFVVLLIMNVLLFLVSLRIYSQKPNTMFIFMGLFSTILLFPFLMRQSLSVLLFLFFTLNYFNRKCYVILLFSIIFIHLSSVVFVLNYCLYTYFKKVTPVIFVFSMLAPFFVDLEFFLLIFDYYDVGILSTKLNYYKNLSIDVAYDYYAIFNGFVIMLLISLNPRIVRRCDGENFVLWCFFISSSLFFITLNIPTMSGRLGYLLVYMAPISFVLLERHVDLNGPLQVLIVRAMILISIVMTIKRTYSYILNEGWLKFDLGPGGNILMNSFLV